MDKLQRETDLFVGCCEARRVVRVLPRRGSARLLTKMDASRNPAGTVPGSRAMCELALPLIHIDFS